MATLRILDEKNNIFIEDPLAPGDDVVYGNGGNDTIYAGTGNNVLSGGDGNDKLGTASSTGENFLDGGSGDDVLMAGHGNDVLVGGSGNDVLRGGDGNDTINGGTGADVLDGGAGADVFKFSFGDTLVAGMDTFAGGGFEHGIDKLQVGLANWNVTTAGITTFLHLDMDRDGIFESGVKFLGNPTITASDIIR